MIKYSIEESLQDFKAWMGGKDTLDDLRAHNAVDKAEEYINLIAYEDKLLTQVQINDILWFDRDSIYEYCGIYEAVYGVTDENDEEEE